jgi:hypothetical protein
MLSLSFHLRPIMTLCSHFQVLGEKSWLGHYCKSTSHAINIENAPYKEGLVRSVLSRAAQKGMIFLIWVIFD